LEDVDVGRLAVILALPFDALLEIDELGPRALPSIQVFRGLGACLVQLGLKLFQRQAFRRLAGRCRVKRVGGWVWLVYVVIHDDSPVDTSFSIPMLRAV